MGSRLAGSNDAVLPKAFVLFGSDHLGALAATAASASGLSWVVRRQPASRLADGIRVGLAVLLLAGTAAYLVAEKISGTLTLWHVVPLHLCDLAIFLGAYALLTRNPRACELLYFWACTGTLLALVTPDVQTGFPHWRCLSFFFLHGVVLVASITLVHGYRIEPGKGAPWRAFLLTNAYAALVGIVNLAFGTNFLFLREKPGSRTLLDSFGPWPYYLVACEGLALGLFLLLDLPFRLARKARAPLA